MFVCWYSFYRSWAEWTLAGKKATQIFNLRPGWGLNQGPEDWEAEILPLRQPLRYTLIFCIEVSFSVCYKMGNICRFTMVCLLDCNEIVCHRTFQLIITKAPGQINFSKLYTWSKVQNTQEQQKMYQMVRLPIGSIWGGIPSIGIPGSWGNPGGAPIPGGGCMIGPIPGGSPSCPGGPIGGGPWWPGPPGGPETGGPAIDVGGPMVCSDGGGMNGGGPEVGGMPGGPPCGPACKWHIKYTWLTDKLAGLLANIIIQVGRGWDGCCSVSTFRI